MSQEKNALDITGRNDGYANVRISHAVTFGSCSCSAQDMITWHISRTMVETVETLHAVLAVWVINTFIIF